MAATEGREILASKLAPLARQCVDEGPTSEGRVVLRGYGYHPMERGSRPSVVDERMARYRGGGRASGNSMVLNPV